MKKVLEGLGFFFPSNLVVYILCSLENDKLFFKWWLHVSAKGCSCDYQRDEMPIKEGYFTSTMGFLGTVNLAMKKKGF